MIRISKDEKNALLKQGCKYHNDIFKTHTKHPTYYLKESEKNLNKLAKLRDYN